MRSRSRRRVLLVISGHRVCALRLFICTRSHTLHATTALDAWRKIKGHFHGIFSATSARDFNSALQAFLADVITPDGTTLTLHCPNTGAMTGCATPGDTVWYSTSENTKRKYPHARELTQTQSGAFICVNTLWANRLTKEAIQNALISELSNYSILKSEVKYGAEGSRIDFCYRRIPALTAILK